jgi:hypothetical protein
MVPILLDQVVVLICQKPPRGRRGLFRVSITSSGTEKLETQLPIDDGRYFQQ